MPPRPQRGLNQEHWTPERTTWLSFRGNGAGWSSRRNPTCRDQLVASGLAVTGAPNASATRGRIAIWATLAPHTTDD
jgi:hypothetical protein